MLYKAEITIKNQLMEMISKNVKGSILILNTFLEGPKKGAKLLY